MQKKNSKNILLNIDNEISNSLPEKAELLFEHQLKNWKLASDGYKSLKKVERKIFGIEDFLIEAHYNPGRVVSSSAKVDHKSISERPCFLCAQNLPEDQKAISIINDYILLVNPFPIFAKHFTIPSVTHSPQAIKNEIENFLIISSMLGKNYTLFYNGPKCGASAPDHLHFQAGNFGFMRIDKEFDSLPKEYRKIIFEDSELVLSAHYGYLRNYFSIESSNRNKIQNQFKRIYKLLEKGNETEEPMLNLICYFNCKWRLLIFPRTKHRPSYFFEEGENNILISPAAVDLGGVMIFPKEDDFKKVNKDLIIDVFKQVTIDDNELSVLSSKLAG